jgi:hypothetical protein
MTDQGGQFIISAIVHGEGGLLRVVGRCGSEPIHLGSRYHALYRHRTTTLQDLAKPAEREDETTVELTVKQIQAYGRELDELGPGMTGSIGLVGTGSERVESGWILGQPVKAAAPK